MQYTCTGFHLGGGGGGQLPLPHLEIEYVYYDCCFRLREGGHLCPLHNFLNETLMYIVNLLSQEFCDFTILITYRPSYMYETVILRTNGIS